MTSAFSFSRVIVGLCAVSCFILPVGAADQRSKHAAFLHRTPTHGQFFPRRHVPFDLKKGRLWAPSASLEEFTSEGPLEKLCDNFNCALVSSLKSGIDAIMHDRPFARFYALETIARVPYFAYLSVLHLQETLGWWRSSDLLQIHFAESWNELHHLRIMEELGGNSRFIDRFVAQHAAFAYFWMAVLFYLVNPKYAYNLNRHVEEHAFKTYAQFVVEEQDWLKTQPVPKAAKDYYEQEDLYLFDRFHTTTGEIRRPVLNSLYDVFSEVRDDEAEHASTMGHLEKSDRASLK